MNPRCCVESDEKHSSHLKQTALTRLTWLNFYPRNGICIQKYNFWPKNDGEKWSRKICFEIPPCRKIVIFITDFVILGTFDFGHFFEVKESSLPPWRNFKKIFLDHFLHHF